MTYKLEPFIEKIVSPIVCVFGEERAEYEDGLELSAQKFDLPWVIEKMSAIDGKIVLHLTENKNINTTEWTNKNQNSPSFF